MSARPKLPFRWPVAIVVVASIAMLFGGCCILGIVDAIRGPTPQEAYEYIFDKPPPPYVSDLRVKHYLHLKGSGLFLGFVAERDKLAQIIDLADSDPMYYPDVDWHDHWSVEREFREMYPEGLPDLKAARILRTEGEGESREIVVCPNTGHVFFFWLLDTDI